MILSQEPQKSLYQVSLIGKVKELVIRDIKVVAYTPTEAVDKAKVGSYLKEVNLKREDVDLYVSVVGNLYPEFAFADSIAKTPELTTAEKATCAEIKATLEK